MSSHLVLSVVYVHVCQRLTSSLTSLNAVTAETMRDPCILQFTLMIIIFIDALTFLQLLLINITKPHH